jgi:hypothetical protein
MVAATDKITLWNDFLLKSRFSALSSSFTMKQQQKQEEQQMDPSALDILPDEILIHIISQSLLDLNDLGHVLEVSQRMCQLGLHVFIQYRLPSLKFAVSIDQEGRNRITSKFQFNQLDEVSLSISLICLGKTPRRYYSNKASPIIRSILITDTYHQQRQHKESSYNGSVPNSDTYISIQGLASTTDDTDNFSFKSKECDITPAEQLMKDYLLSIPTITSTTTKENSRHHKKLNIINCKIQTRKEGLNSLQVPRHPLILHNNSQVSWKFEYKISKQQRHEYHLLPSNITIQLNQLLLLENNGRQQGQHQDRKWGSKMVGWVINRCR